MSTDLSLGPDRLIGQTVDDRYVIEGVLGQGGMGVVFAGRHKFTDRPVAIKLLHGELCDDAHVVDRFLVEAKAAGGLSHPNIVDVLDAGRDASGTVYLVLERLSGRSLAEALAAVGPVDAATAISWLLPILGALAQAHERGVLHRDLKPDNVFLHEPTPGTVVPKLLDFGIAKLTTTPSATRSGTLIGTPHYMSPEQANASKDLTTAADVWSLGVVLYECLTGARPFNGETLMEVLVAISMGPAVRVLDPKVPGAVSRVVERALARPLEERYPTVVAFADALREAAVAAGLELTAPARLPPAHVTRVAQLSGQSGGAAADAPSSFTHAARVAKTTAGRPAVRTGHDDPAPAPIEIGELDLPGPRVGAPTGRGAPAVESIRDGLTDDPPKPLAFALELDERAMRPAPPKGAPKSSRSALLMGAVFALALAGAALAYYLG